MTIYRYCRKCNTSHVVYRDVGEDTRPPLRLTWGEVGEILLATVVWSTLLVGLLWLLPAAVAP